MPEDYDELLANFRNLLDEFAAIGAVVQQMKTNVHHAVEVKGKTACEPWLIDAFQPMSCGPAPGAPQ